MQSLLRTSPESVGIPSGALFHMVSELNKLDSLNSIMVMRHGKVCLEAWWKPFPPEEPHILFSLSKSFTSVAIGMAQAEGLLKISDRLISFFSEYEQVITDPKMNTVTLRHLLTMSSGHAACAREFMLNEPEGNWVKGFLASPLRYEPGSFFAYNSAATYMLAAVLHKVAGMNVREYLVPRLFDVLGMTPGIWECCPKGINTGGWGFYLKTEDIAKFAQLLLNGGVWQGREVIPADYFREATSKQIDNSANELPDWKVGYGYQFWRSRHGFRGDGASGQYAIALPEKDLAIAVTAGLVNMQLVLDIFWETLLPAVTDEVLPEDKEAQSALTELVESLEIPLAAGDLTLRRPPVKWSFRSNAAGIKDVEISFGEKDCTLVFHTENGEETLTAGFGFNSFGTLTLGDYMPRKVAASAAWVKSDVLKIEICCYETAFRETFTVDFASPDKPLTGERRFGVFRPAFLPELEIIS